ncbi:hypothetical protein PMIN06_006486 [Paraphaeosphaeria minitans]|uniref:Uncharacterized protein n=1 Tax=Paraphaeosphaeria minitans TaxID=565426 RepID=A0A9P6KRE2_9PLEO|nr:hypothetical protein PMIN01_06032 [Paraphaeosphaeria minitans]
MANENKDTKEANDKKEAESEESSQNGYSKEEVQKESSKAAKQAKEAHNKATELLQAAAAAGDPDERQKLMEEALEQQIRSKSFGKTARYLRSGTFQGMAVGAGLGIAPGASLGAITGTLVGGISSTALGGLGAGLGAATGWMHGPFWDLGKEGKNIIKKITDNLPGWKATESQKKQLEKMLGQVNEQDTPGMDELESWESEGPSEDQKKVMENVKSKMPSMPSQSGSAEPSNKGENQKETAQKNEGEEEQSKTEDSIQTKTSQSQGEENDDNDDEKKKTKTKQGGEGRRKPRKLQPKSDETSAPSDSSVSAKKQPRKLEKRSG